jgi:DNA (cytosine-5)-methyltransferase 1
MMLSVLSLFSGIGAFDLGLERTNGFRTAAFVEIDLFCRRVLAKHWPGVPQYDDVRTLTGARLAADGIVPDVIIGGFPCTDISVAGKGAGIEGQQSGLWSEFARLIGEIRPRYVLVENVAALLGRGMGRVLGDLSALGYDAEWDIISAADMGAPHRRERVWIIAHPGGEGRREILRGAHGDEGADGTQHMLLAGSDGAQRDVAYPEGRGARCGRDGPDALAVCGGAGRAMADAGEPGLSASERDQLRGTGRGHEGRATAERGWWRPQSSLGLCADGIAAGMAGPWGADWEDGIPRVAHGVPDRVSRLKALGNSLVPQIPELLGRMILAAEAERAI